MFVSDYFGLSDELDMVSKPLLAACPRPRLRNLSANSSVLRPVRINQNSSPSVKSHIVLVPQTPLSLQRRNVIQLIGSNCTVQDNYIHNVDGGGIVLELGGHISNRAPFIGNTFCGNLIERCGDSLYIRNNDDEIAETFGEMTIDDNYVIDT